ncbi:GTPase ObgE [Thermanaerothrix daxensis]|uniref:GTPase Obg n=1 Tax=Thermanaerothrix daxensis TaxID=869279 RepID=A0A0P6XH23_9CHLR|nr:GTPase ObgE [Thermanaerothrix daxensis]KPL82815.1 GTPase ObgE [Thermanaerothrix daxensis]
MFIDEARIYVRSGKGGDGIVHFHREKYVARGGPDGGDGGRGGDVILEVVPSLNTLVKFRYQRRFIAQDGGRGGPNNMTGRSGEDLVIPVPPGTVVYDDDTGELLGDLVEPGQRLVVCRGGRGGRGNARFATPRNQAPRIAEKGEPGQERNLRLELKLIADVGIVGVPNAGKSSFLAAVTNAKPKIADYPFTTLEPNLGVADLDANTSLVLADIPGLVEGAHRGVGLGDAFLRHIQRTKVLIHLLDGLSPDPVADYAQINSELALFDPELTRKPMIVALNKIDLPEVQERWPEIERSLKERGVEPVAISALKKIGLQPILWRCAELVKQAPEVLSRVEMPVYRPSADPRAFQVLRLPDGSFKVTGEAVERAAAMTYWEYEESVRRFQKLMETLGVDEALRQAGIQNGDTVFIGDHYELEWQE